MSEIPVGLCQCGCGEPAFVPSRNKPSAGHVKDVPRPYAKGHHDRRCNTPPINDGLTTSQRFYRRHRERRLAEAKERNKRPDVARQRRSNILKRKYGITIEDFDRMYNEQAGACKACEEPIPYVGQDINVDHCHASGKVRGLLCRGCNGALGMLGEDPDRILGLLRYAENECGQRSSLEELAS